MPRRSAAWSTSAPAVQGQDVSRRYWACAPLIAGARLRTGNTVSGHGASTLLASSIKTIRTAGVTVRAKAWFSVSGVTARMDPAVKKAIAGIPETAWVPIKYPNATWDEQEQRWICSAHLTKTTNTRVHVLPEGSADHLPARRPPGRTPQPPRPRRPPDRRHTPESAQGAGKVGR